MTHSCVGLFSPWSESPGGNPVAPARSSGVQAPSGCLAAEVLRPYCCEMLADLAWPKWSARDVFTNLLAPVSDLHRTIGEAIAIPPICHVTPDAVQFNVFSDNWIYLNVRCRLCKKLTRLNCAGS
jgi:hypothetical protein